MTLAEQIADLGADVADLIGAYQTKSTALVAAQQSIADAAVQHTADAVALADMTAARAIDAQTIIDLTNQVAGGQADLATANTNLAAAVAAAGAAQITATTAQEQQAAAEAALAVEIANDAELQAQLAALSAQIEALTNPPTPVTPVGEPTA